MRSKNQDTIINIINNRGEFSKNILNAKKLFSVNELVGLFQMLQEGSDYKKYLDDINSTKTYDGLITTHCFLPICFFKKDQTEKFEEYNIYELKFLTSIICYYSDIVKQFLNVRKSFEHYFMLSEYTKAEAVLDDFEKNYGYSFWGIEARLAIYFLRNIEQTAFNYCDNISKMCKDKAIAYYIEILRDKMSLDINQRLFKERFNRNIELINNLNKSKKDYKHFALELYANFTCFPPEKLSPTIFSEIMIASSILSVVDKYILLEKLIINISSEPLDQHSDKFLKHFKDCLLILSSRIDNVLWDNVKLLLGYKIEFKVNTEKQIVHKALSFFCSKHYDKCWEFCKDQIKNHANNFSLINLMAKIGKINNPESQYEHLINHINELYKKESNESYFKIANQCDINERFYTNFTFGQELISTIENETSHNKDLCKKQYLASLLTYNFVPSKLVFFLPQVNQDWFISEYKKSFHELFLCDWQLISYINYLNPEIVQQFIYDEISQIVIHLAYKDHDLSILNDCKNHANFISSIQAMWLFDTCLNNNQYKDAINIYINAHFTNFWFVIRIDYLELNKRINRRFEQTYGNNIEYCVYSSITKYNWQETEKVSESVVSSYKRTMKQHNEEYPSNLSWPTSHIGKKCHAYFLRFICVNEVLHRCDPPFTLQQNINEERIKIARSLIKYYKDIDDKESVKVLNEEIDLLLKSIEIRDITNLIDNAKVDTSLIHITNNTDDAIMLTYSRCFSNNININSYSKKEMYFEYLTGLSIFKKNYVNEVNRILSSNIRHGVLEDKIIQFLNSYGIDRDTQDNDSINSFFNQVYVTINYVIDQYIWATSEKNAQEGISLFIPETLAQKYYSEITHMVNSPESLKGYFLKIFETQLSQELIRIGNLVFDKLYESLQFLLNDLIGQTTGSNKIEFKKCKDTLESELLIIKQWFGIIEYNTVKYNLTTFIDLFNENHPKILLNKKISKDYKISGSTMNYLNNILFNFASNATKHSGFSASSRRLKLNLSVDQFEESNRFTFIFSNNVSSKIESKNILESIKNIEYLLINKNNIETYQATEGKSGYQKIIYLLEHTFQNSWSLNVTFDEVERIFNVKLDIELE